MFSTFYTVYMYSMFYVFSVWIQALGSWVLVGSVTDEKTGLLPQLSSSLMELSLSEHNISFTYIERNKFVDTSCLWLHVVGDITDDANLTVSLHTMGKFPINIINNKLLACQRPSRRDVACYEALRVEPWRSGPQNDGLASSC